MPSEGTGSPEENNGGGVAIHPVRSRQDLERFLDVAERVFADDPAWIPPIRAERRGHLSSRHNPFFEHADARLWTAWRDGHPIGRISAQVDSLHLEWRKEACGFFGMLDGLDDPEVFGALLQTAEGWLARRGMARVRGPFNLSINSECGLLVSGFEHSPRILMPHHRPYYGAHLAAQGYRPARDLLAYRLAASFGAPPAMRRAAERYGKGVTIRPLRRTRMRRELATLRFLFNDAWAENWGFVPFTAAELGQLGSLLRFLMPRTWVQIAERDGQAIGMIVLLPDLNQTIADLEGRLGLAGGARLLWRLARLRVSRGRVALLGILRDLQGTPVGGAVAHRLIAALQEAGRARGLEEVELSWILEDNYPMRHIIEELGGEAYKRYRILEKELAG